MEYDSNVIVGGDVQCDNYMDNDLRKLYQLLVAEMELQNSDHRVYYGWVSS